MKVNFELDPVQWSRLRGLLDGALALAPAERATWIKRLGPEDEDLKSRLRALLAHAAGDSSPLDTLPHVETAQFLAECAQRGDGDALAPGAAAGPYRLIRPLGEGGMGAVWLAERADMLQKRQVALKLPRLLTGRAALAERLAREREILAALNHPHIARLYDAGLTADGRPYLALEYVEGERIDAYCARKALDVAARLRLFVQVARAVAHAHAQLIVHRDLKPANILVTEAGDVKLLDFGIAKLLEDGRAQETELTQLGGRALTPDYAAPEQILGQSIATAADVYALGVVLFELLTGQRPYRLKRDSRAALEEAIVAAEPARPSAAVADAKLKKRLRGDLDTIVAKALKKNPAERYSSAEALAADVERHLAQRPVHAQPDSRWYRVRKFVARNRLAVGAAAVITLAILTGAGVALWQAQVARAEQRRADEVKRFVTGLFTDADPFNTATGELTVEALLQIAQTRVQQASGQSDALRVELLDMIGRSLIGLGKFDRAEQVLRQAADEGARTLGERHRLTIRARLGLTTLHRFAGRTAQWRAELALLLPHLRTNGEVYAEELFGAVMNSAHLAIDEGRHADAQREAREALSLAQRVFGPGHPETAVASLVVASADNFGSDAEQALTSATHARDLVIANYGTHRPHARVLDGRFVYARALANIGRYAEAVDELAVVKRDTQTLLGPKAPMAGFVAADLARFQLELGQAEPALRNSEEALRILSGVAQEDSFTMAAARHYVGRAQLAMRHTEAATRSLALARESMLKVRRPDGPEVAGLTALHALALAYGGRAHEAQRAVAAELTRWRALASPLKSRILHSAGITQRLAGETGAAVELQQEALAALPQLPVHAYQRARIQAELARLALERGQAGEALRLLDELPARMAANEPATPEAADQSLARGRAKLALGQAAQALPDLQRAAEFWRQHAPDSAFAGEVAYWQGRCLAALGRTVEARAADARAARLLRDSPFSQYTALTRIFQCAVKRRCLPVGANPTRQLSLQPEAIGAIVEATKRLKPSV